MFLSEPNHLGRYQTNVFLNVPVNLSTWTELFKPPPSRLWFCFSLSRAGRFSRPASDPPTSGTYYWELKVFLDARRLHPKNYLLFTPGFLLQGKSLQTDCQHQSHGKHQIWAGTKAAEPRTGGNSLMFTGWLFLCSPNNKNMFSCILWTQMLWYFNITLTLNQVLNILSWGHVSDFKKKIVLILCKILILNVFICCKKKIIKIKIKVFKHQSVCN